MSDGLTEAWGWMQSSMMRAKNCRFYEPSDIKVDENKWSSKPFICKHSKACPADRERCDCQ
jgi:hypothetical protein